MKENNNKKSISNEEEKNTRHWRKNRLKWKFSKDVNNQENESKVKKYIYMKRKLVEMEDRLRRNNTHIIRISEEEEKFLMK